MKVPSRLSQAMYVLLAVSFIFNVPIYCARTSSPKNMPGKAIFVMSEKPSITLNTKKIQIKKQNINLNLSVPQLSGLTDKAFQKSLNKELYSQAKQRKKEMLKLAEAFNQDLSADQLSLINFEYIENYTSIQSTEPYFVIELFKYQYSGGAHGLSELSYIIIDTTQNKVVNLKDLFKENVDYRSLIDQEVKMIIEERRQQGEFFFEGSDGFQSIHDDQAFFINYKGDLVLVFNVYEIAPYAAGPIYISIPQEKLLPYLK